MIKIQNLMEAKKITAKLFSGIKGQKITLNSFRTLFAKEFGYNSLSDAFKKDDEEKLAKIKESYITYIDDPRITIEVARIIQSDEDYAEEYFNKNFKDPSDDILFPVKDHYALLRRCEQILILWNETDWFSQKNFINLIMRLSMPKGRISYVFDGNENSNPELLMALELIGYNRPYSSLEDLLKIHIDFYKEGLFTPENGFYEAIQKTKLFLAGIIWTQTHVGLSYVDKVANQQKDILKRNHDYFVKNRSNFEK